MVFFGVRDAISPFLRYSKLFAAILGPEYLVDFLFKGFLIIGCVPVMALRLRVRFRAGALVCVISRLPRMRTSVVSRTFPVTFGSRCGVELELQPRRVPHQYWCEGALGAPMRVMLKHLVPRCGTKCYWCGVHICPPGRLGLITT